MADIFISVMAFTDHEKNAAWKNPNELPNQIKLLRQYPECKGKYLFQQHLFDRNPNGWNDSLRNNYYKIPAMIPEMDWLPKKNGTH